MAIPADAEPLLKIRKIMQARLEVVLDDLYAANLIKWPNRAFDKQKALEQNMGPGLWVEPTFHPTGERAMTLGPAPRVQNDGFMTVGINVEPGIGQDLMDLTIGRLKAGFPYSIPLVRDGLSIEITRRLAGTANTVDGWYYLPLSIYWTLWRET